MAIASLSKMSLCERSSPEGRTPFPVAAAGSDLKALNASLNTFKIDPFNPHSLFRIESPLDLSSSPLVYREIKRSSLCFHNNTREPVELTCVSLFDFCGDFEEEGSRCSINEVRYIEPGRYSTPLHLRHNRDLPFSAIYKVEGDETPHPLPKCSVVCYEDGQLPPSSVQEVVFFIKREGPDSPVFSTRFKPNPLSRVAVDLTRIPEALEEE